MDTSTHQQRAQGLIDYILREIGRGRRGLEIHEDTPLVSSGLVDSFALVGIIAKLEDITATRISAGKIQPNDLDTVRLMLATAERIGKIRH